MKKHFFTMTGYTNYRAIVWVFPKYNATITTNGPRWTGKEWTGYTWIVCEKPIRIFSTLAEAYNYIKANN